MLKRIYISAPGYFALWLVLLALCWATPLGTYLSPAAMNYSDTVSDVMLQSDMYYAKNVGSPGTVVNHLPLEKTTADGAPMSSTRIWETLRSEEGVPEQAWGHYTSNLVVQRWGFIVLAKLLPFATAVRAAKALTLLLSSAAYAGLLLWLRGVYGQLAANVAGVLLCLLSPVLANFATNLYWSPYTWLLPLLAVAWAVGQQGRCKSQRSFLWLLAATAFTTCFIKQLFYFEFVSCAMVAMLLPVLAGLQGRKGALATLLAPSLGALASFPAALLVHSLALTAGGQGGLGTILERALYRTHSAETAGSFAAMGYDTSLQGVLHTQLTLPPLALHKIGISLYILFGILLIVTVFSLLLKRPLPGPALAWFAALGPLSWVCLATLHVVDHMAIDFTVWYIGFLPVCYAAVTAGLAGLLKKPSA